ncbi:MAG TPA: mechanosensitive ion channel family protein [Acetobacteraceae bacterium]|nr:mechanosensitive ion channel family protein [Acetobacteraceae bacterium]
MMTSSEALLSLALASVLMLATALDTRFDRKRPLWLRLVIRVTVFGAATWFMRRAIGSPVTPHLRAATTGEQIWMQLAEIGWWILGARVAVDIVRLVVVLENQPRETKIVSDLVAGAIYTATILSVFNFVFGVAIAGLVATSGVVAIILGLALQSTLADVFSGIAVGLERAYKPGDLIWVEGGIEGRVLQVNWRSTQIATPHDSIAIVPNSVIAKSRLENRSAPTPTRNITVTVNADAAIDPRRVIAALNAAALACRIPLSVPAPTFECVSLLGDGNAYEVRFFVSSSDDVRPARTEMLAQIHRHLLHAGIGFGVGGVAPLPSPSVPTIQDLLAESDMFGALAPEERGVFAEHFVAVRLEKGETLIREGEMPEAVFLLSGGTVEVARGEGNRRQVLLCASPGDTLGMIGLITGMASFVTATALTPLMAYRLDKTEIAAVLRIRPGLEGSLEAQARRGHTWLHCEAAAHEQDQMMQKPDMLLARLRQFLHRLNQ